MSTITRTPIDIERLREVLNYDQDTGVFTRKTKTGRKGRVGQVVGSAHSQGYLTCMIDGQVHFMHRIAWAYTTGEWPSLYIDHINGDRSDNRFINLRLATMSQNASNCFRSGRKQNLPRGVHMNKHGRFHVQIRAGGKHHYLGTFGSLEEARETYLAGAAKLCGAFHPEIG